MKDLKTVLTEALASAPHTIKDPIAINFFKDYVYPEMHRYQGTRWSDAFDPNKFVRIWNRFMKETGCLSSDNAVIKSNIVDSKGGSRNWSNPTTHAVIEVTLMGEKYTFIIDTTQLGPDITGTIQYKNKIFWKIDSEWEVYVGPGWEEWFIDHNGAPMGGGGYKGWLKGLK